VKPTVTFRHIDPSAPIRTHAEEKVERPIKKYLKDALGAQVRLSVTRQRHMAEIQVHAANFDISASQTTGDLYSAVDAAVSKLEAQLRKHKDRINHRKGGASLTATPTKIPVDVYAIADSDDSATRKPPVVVTQESMPATPLTIEDAIIQLELQDQAFLVFRNSSTDVISVVYRRNDGTFGLIAPGA